MPFRTADQMLCPDPITSSSIIDEAKRRPPADMAEYHAIVADLALAAGAPTDVAASFDRARSILLYAWFDYDLLVPAQTQALATVELALRHRVYGNGGPTKATFYNLITLARKQEVLPPLGESIEERRLDMYEVLRHLRNALAHGNADRIHPSQAVDVLRICRMVISNLYPAH